MNVGNASSVGTAAAAPAAARASSVAPVAKGGRDADGDSDGTTAVPASPAPTVNTSGQSIGRLINVTA